MTDKPSDYHGYPPDLAADAKRTCLYVATILGHLIDDIVVVGGLVPSLIIDQDETPLDARHVGTRDLDLGLSLALLDEGRYREIASRLRERGFAQATNEAGRPTRQTWRLDDHHITVDFLIAPTNDQQRGGSLQNLEKDFAAMVMPALPVAFIDRQTVTLEGTTPRGERARRDVQVAGPAAFVVMKAYALRLRGANKDSYDLVYVLTHLGPDPVAAAFAKIAHHPAAHQALTWLAEDFASEAHLGPMRYAEFLGDRLDANTQQDAFGAVLAFLDAARRGAS